jgi:hypothetical protein
MRIERRSGTRRTSVELIAGRNARGEGVREEVLVDDHGYGVVRITRSPGLVLGLAAGDLVRIDRATGSFELLQRGGNLAVQVYGPHEVVDEATAGIRALGGRLDGRAPDLTVFTVPAAEGIGGLSAVLDELADRHPAVEWDLGNAYGEDGELLRWWEE